MPISRKKYVLLFLFCVIAFQFISNALLGSGIQLFTPENESFLGAAPATGWQQVVYNVLLPIKAVLFAPVLPYPDFLRDDPPPPFVLAFFLIYWSILALVIHFVIFRISSLPYFKA